MNELMKQDAGTVQREEFGSTQLTRQAETAVAGIAARERAAVEARYVMAERHPRDLEQFRLALLKECKRPGFADHAEYARPVGGGKIAKGPTIRFIEGALRCFKNVFPEVATTFESDDLRIVRVTVTDLEGNLSFSSDIQITKRVERRGIPNRNTGAVQPPDGREVLGQRTTSEKNLVYIVRATDDELLIKTNALVSKAMRTLAQRLLPADIIEECMIEAKKTLSNRDADDPDKAKRALIDAFDGVGVSTGDLRDYLGHDLERIQPADMQSLRQAFSAMREGDTTWDAIMQAQPISGSREEQETAAKETLDKLRARAEAPAREAAPKKTRGRRKAQPKDMPEAPPPETVPAPEFNSVQHESLSDIAAADSSRPEAPAAPLEGGNATSSGLAELPDPADAYDGQVVIYQGEPWEFVADSSAWRRQTPPQQPAPTHPVTNILKEQTGDLRLSFGSKPGRE